VIHFHGTEDTLVPYEGGGATGSPSVAETIAGWRVRDGCADTSTLVFDMGDSTCEAWSTCDAGSEVIVCTVDGGGHWWPGGPGSTSNVDATDSMWDFFVRHPMP
jgi:polyhydroxybutyrate depolymerase